MRHLRLVTTAVVLSVAAIGSTTVNAAEQQLNPKAITIKLPDQIPWKRNAAGTNEVAVLVGDPSKPGLYVQMFKWLPGNMSRPHWHPNDRYITVLKGPWWSAPETSSSPKPPPRSRPAAMWSTPARRCTTTAPRTARSCC